MILSGVMKLKEGMKEEYKKRHDNLWPEMKEELLNAGVKTYYIHFDKTDNKLYSFVEVENLNAWNKIGETKTCQKWWLFMKDIMEVNQDNSPVYQELEQVFKF